MTDASILRMAKVIDTCDRILADKYPNAQVSRNPHAVTTLGRVGHLRWMLEESRDLAMHSKFERAYQWLGFVQGFMFSEHLVTIQTLQLVDILGYLPDNSG